MSRLGKIVLASNDAASLSRELAAQGFEVLAAQDAINVLAIARQEQPDVVLLSSRLAGGGASVALQRLRRNVYTTNIPVIALMQGGAQASQLLEGGAQACVDRPDDTAAVRAAIDAHMLQSLDFTEAPADALASTQRMAAVADTRLLDTPPEASFDRLTRLASRLLGVKSALVTLVDRDRQFFKSQVGLAEPWASARQTALSHSFCQWVVADNDQLVVGDAKSHPVLSRNLAVRDLGVIAYAGIPLAPRDGQAIGSFCAIESHPRDWSEEDLATLRDLARVAEAYAALEMARRAKAAGDGGAPATLALTLRIAGDTMLGVKNLLARMGPRLGEEDRADLLAILDEQGRHLLDLAVS